MSLPSVVELAAAVLQHALRDDSVLGGDCAMLYAVDDSDGKLRSGSQILQQGDLEGAVIEGKLLLALSQTPRTALCYLAVLAGRNGDKVGLQIEARAEGPAVASFGAPLGARGDRPEAEGELWALNAAARAALDALG